LHFHGRVAARIQDLAPVHLRYPHFEHLAVLRRRLNAEDTEDTEVSPWVFSDFLRVLRVLCVDSPPLTPTAAAVSRRLEAQRFLAQRPDERLIVDRGDDDAGLGDGVPAAIFFGVVAD